MRLDLRLAFQSPTEDGSAHAGGGHSGSDVVFELNRGCAIMTSPDEYLTRFRFGIDLLCQAVKTR